MSVLEAEHYKEEELNLMLDPIIQFMAAEIKDEDLKTLDMESWEFIKNALDTYHERHGKLARSIGGPARAIKSLVDGRPAARKRLAEKS